MYMTNILFWQLSAVFLYMNILFLVAVIKRRNDLADVAWGIGFVILAATTYYFHPSFKTGLIFFLVFLWGGRLAWHIGLRFLKKKDEDPRYKKWREDWGKNWLLRTWAQVFMLQGLFMLLVAMTIISVGLFDDGSWNVINVIGVVIFVFGLVFEAIGDYQLKSFLKRREASGQIMKSGLWRYTRHPNYFGEVVLWWGLWLLSFGTPYVCLALISPLTISFLILRVSGIPMLEKRYEGNPDFEDYKKTTNAFFPWKPKK
jgi:steroid 5-alpha reductase family enzyme